MLRNVNSLKKIEYKSLLKSKWTTCWKVSPKLDKLQWSSKLQMTNITHYIWPSLTLYGVLLCNTSHDIIKLEPLYHSNNFYMTAVCWINITDHNWHHHSTFIMVPCITWTSQAKTNCQFVRRILSPLITETTDVAGFNFKVFASPFLHLSLKT